MHFAPLYPAALAAIGLLGADLWDAARWLNAFLFAANIFLVGVLILRHTRAPAWAAVGGAIAMLCSITMLRWHASAMSDPMFIFLALSGFYFLAKYAEGPRLGLLIVAGGLFGVAFATRYVGASLIPTGIIALLVLGGRKVRGRIFNAFILTLTACLPILAWLARNFVLNGTARVRPFAFHGYGVWHVEQALGTFAQWLLPGGFSHYVELAFTGFLLLAIVPCDTKGIAAFFRTFRRQVAATPFLVKLLAIFIPIYLALAAASRAFFDAATPFDDRILSPVFVAGVIIAFSLLGRLLPSARAAMRLRAVPLLLCMLAIAAAYIISGTAYVVQSRADGIGFGSREWANSETIAWLRGFSPGLVIYSNEPNAVIYQTH